MSNSEDKTRELSEEDKALANRIKELRVASGLTQQDLSEKIDKYSSYINYVETLRRGLSLPTLYNIAKALNVPLKELFDFK